SKAGSRAWGRVTAKPWARRRVLLSGSIGSSSRTGPPAVRMHHRERQGLGLVGVAGASSTVRSADRRFPGGRDLRVLTQCCRQLSFPLTAAGQSRIHTEFPLTTQTAPFRATLVPGAACVPSTAVSIGSAFSVPATRLVHSLTHHQPKILSPARTAQPLRASRGRSLSSSPADAHPTTNAEKLW